MGERRYPACNCGHNKSQHAPKFCRVFHCPCTGYVGPAAAPTPVEPEEISEDDYYNGEPCPECGRPCLECDCPATPAESQGVERAQPVEPAQCPKCKTWHDSADSVSYCLCNAPDDYRVTVDASYLKSLLRRPAAPVEGVERVTDDRPAETIPDVKRITIRWDHTFGSQGAFRVSEPRWNGGTVVMAEDYDGLKAHAETRIEVLEAALVRLRDCDWVISLPDRMDAVRDIARAALAAPSGEKAP